MKNIVKCQILFNGIFLLFLSLPIHGQLQFKWQQSYGGSSTDKAMGIEMDGSGYIVLGYTASNNGLVGYNHGASDYWVVRTDSVGNLLYEKTYGGSSGDRLEAGFRAANSDDIYLVGQSSSTDGDISHDPYDGEANLWAVRLDAAGNILWDRKVGSPIGFWYDQMGAPAADGGVLMAAQNDHAGGDISVYYGGYDGWIIKLNSNGETDWDFSIGTSAFEFINEVRQTSDGEYLASLSGMPNGIDGNIHCTCINNSPDAIAYKIDDNGKGVWHRCYGGSHTDAIHTICETSDGYLMGGSSESSDGDLLGLNWHGGFDIWLFKTDFEGEIIWQKMYGGSNDEYPVRIFETTENDFLVFGITNSFDCDVQDNPSSSTYEDVIWVFKVNAQGDFLWQQCIGGAATERVNDVTYLPDNSYLVAASMEYSPSGDVNCSNFVSGWGPDLWAFQLTDLTVNVNEKAEKAGLRIFPNPATSLVNIQLPSHFIPENTMISIIDCVGKEALAYHPASLRCQINTKTLHHGLYMVKIQHRLPAKATEVITKKLIIDKH